VVHISTGDLLREAVKKGTDLGKQAKGYMDKGALVPDELIINLAKEQLETKEAKEHGWLLDGFPRTKEQAEAMAKAGIHAEAFILIEVPDEVLVERVEGRRLDPETGAIYHLKFNPPPDDEKVKKRLTQRSDDNADKLKNRLVEYHKHVSSVEGYFKEILLRVDGNQKPDVVSKAIADGLESTGKKIACFIDGSDHSKVALEQAVAHKRPEDTLILCHAVSGVNWPTGITIPDKETTNSEDLSKFFQNQGNTVLAEAVDYAKKKQPDMKHLKTVLLPSSLLYKDNAADFVNNERVDTVFVGSRGLGAAQRFFLGSFSLHLVNNCNADVVVCRVKTNK